MRISTVTQPLSTELRKIEASRKVEKESKSSKISDHSDISYSGKTLSETNAQFDAIAASLSSLPEIRNDRIADVRSKIESGYYNSEEFLDKLTDKLLKDFGLENNS